MPTSFHRHISFVIDHIIKANPESVLDIGCGWGKWGFLAREYLDIYGKGDKWKRTDWEVRIDGVEIYKPYLEDIEKKWYDKIYNEDIIEIYNKLPNYDLVIMGDVLEHIEKDKGKKLLRDLIERSETLILSIPLEDFTYQFKGENKYESHISIWTLRELLCDYGEPKDYKIYDLKTTNGKELKIGVFIWNSN